MFHNGRWTRPIDCIVQGMKIIYVSKWQMDQTIVLAVIFSTEISCSQIFKVSYKKCVGFKVADGPDP